MKSVDATISATATSGKGLSARSWFAVNGWIAFGMALMGVESEEVMEMMVKLQGDNS